MDQRKYWLAFSLVPAIGPRRLMQLVAHFGDVETAWRASDAALREAGLEALPHANLRRVRSTVDLDAQLARVEGLGIQVVTRADAAYPDLLDSLPDAPAVLYVKGELPPNPTRLLGIVGTRKATTYGRDVARTLARQLVASGVGVVSGMAHGIDAAAHQGALDGGGPTLAVLGTGVDVIYPADHAGLARQIVECGALVSEFPPGTRPDPGNFPRRNRIISGVSFAVLVVEAPEKSGALITAGMAADQGRDVFAVPGNIFSAMSAGTHRLIQDGAKLVARVEDILDELNLASEVAETRRTAERLAPDNPTEALLVAHLGVEPVHVDDLARTVGLPVATVSSTLTLLEMKGIARAVGPMQFCLALDA